MLLFLEDIMTDQNNSTAQLTIDGVDAPIELPIYSGSIGPDVIDVGKLTGQGYFTYDPGFVSTASASRHSGHR
jgi:citrate synthase